MKAEFLEKFRNTDTKEYPDVHALSTLLDKSLWILLIAKEQISIPYLCCGDIARVLTEVYDISATRQGIVYALQNAGRRVHRKKTKGATLFSIMQEGKQSLIPLRSVRLIDPEMAFSGLKGFEEILVNLKGEICICDPWVDKNTLDLFPIISNKHKIRLLTVNIKDHSSFKRYYGAFNNQYGNLEIRVCQTAVLHDRYIISADSMLIIGQSLNGIGKKQTFIIEAGEDIREQMVRVFNQLWAQAKVI